MRASILSINLKMLIEQCLRFLFAVVLAPIYIPLKILSAMYARIQAWREARQRPHVQK